VSAGNAVGDAEGDQRVLVILATWGPEPWAPEEVRRAVFDEANAFYRRSSFGQFSLHGDLTPWLAAYTARPACPAPVHERVAPALADPPLAAARSAGFVPDSYDRVIYVVPKTECPWEAVGVFREVLLNGTMNAWIVVHELGHTYGLAHARGVVCTGSACRASEYGDPLSPMGHGFVDFSAYEKHVMGWITDVSRADQSRVYGVGRPDVVDAKPHAFVVPTATTEYWFEQRLDGPEPGLAVRRLEKDVPDDDLAPPTWFVNAPVRSGRTTLAAGETFSLRGVFSVRYSPSVVGNANLRFVWTDRTRPTPPALLAPGRRVVAGRPVRVAWRRSGDGGSGVAFCTVRLDGRIVTRSVTSRTALIPALRRGAHTIGVTCTDRAGNRSRRVTRRVVATSR
jgi:hypothetical protein